MFTVTLSEAIRIFLIIIFCYFLIPFLFMKRSNNRYSLLDRFFFGFVAIILFQVLSVHLLVMIKLFDVISAVILIIITMLIMVKHDKDRDMFLTRILSKLYMLYDTVDTGRNRNALFQNLKTSFKNAGEGFVRTFHNISKARVYSFLAAAILTLSAIVRFWHSIMHYAYPHLDMYLHLKWIKALINNNLYLDNKIYPKAMHTVVAHLSKLTFSDPYWMLRFFGPFCTVLLVLAIYYLAFKVTGNKYLSLLAMAFYGLIINNNLLPTEVFRQTATMPQEFGMLFIVLGLSFLIDFIRTLSRRHLFAFEACLLIGLMSHSFSGMFLILWTALVVIFSLLAKTIKWKDAVRLVFISALVSIGSFLPLVLGLVLGKVFHESSLEMVTDVTGIQISDFDFTQYFSSLLSPKSALMYLLLLGCFGLLIAISSRRLRALIKNLPVILAIFSSTLLIYLAYNLSNLLKAEKLPELLGKDRTGPFLSLLLPICAAIVLFTVLDLIIYFFVNRNQETFAKLRSMSYSVVITAFITVFLMNGTYNLKTFYKHVEYDQAAEAYIRIKDEFSNNSVEPRNWYIVATDPQLAEVQGYGWYEEGYKFAQDYTKDQLLDPNFQFNYPVNNIFIFVEKKPLFSDKPNTLATGEQELEPLGDDPFMQFYQDANNRAIMEGHIWMLAEAYASSHDQVSIYYEDDNFKIYRIYQEVVANPQ